jgi:SpoVK/Ycf46/Vps4 family AAA+-type ATPase
MAVERVESHSNHGGIFSNKKHLAHSFAGLPLSFIAQLLLILLVVLVTTMSNYDDIDAVLMPPPSKRYRRGTNGTISSLPANASVVNARVIPWQVTVDCVEQRQIERGPDPIQLPSRESCESLEIHEQPPMNSESDGCTISQESFAMEGTTRQKHLNKRERTSMKNNKALPTRSSDEDEQQLDQEILQLTQVTTRFSDIIGHGSVKLRIDEILLPLALPPSLTDSILIGVRASPASILLYGPPGCGKVSVTDYT